MLDDLQRDTMNLLGLTLTSFATLIIAIDNVQVTPAFWTVVATAPLATFLFGPLAMKGAIQMIRNAKSHKKATAGSWTPKIH